MPAKGVIQMIAGVPIDGDSRQAIPAHARAARTIMEIDLKVPSWDPMIYFGPTDTQGVHLPQMTHLLFLLF
ncbi:UNVERIFIED_CONTAM: hypothetical protein Sradi_4868700 [Sesamum radiatum]|uniref:Uncharacterized protein n=1 Tax=Sesamum radiatum TaxID=300843 RepID=A0AAW2N0M9_SESRA